MIALTVFCFAVTAMVFLVSLSYQPVLPFIIIPFLCMDVAVMSMGLSFADGVSGTLITASATAAFVSVTSFAIRMMVLVPAVWESARVLAMAARDSIESGEVRERLMDAYDTKDHGWHSAGIMSVSKLNLPSPRWVWVLAVEDTDGSARAFYGVRFFREPTPSSPTPAPADVLARPDRHWKWREAHPVDWDVKFLSKS